MTGELSLLQVSEHEHLDLIVTWYVISHGEGLEAVMQMPTACFTQDKCQMTKVASPRFLSHLDEPNLKPVITDQSVSFSALASWDLGSRDISESFGIQKDTRRTWENEMKTI